MMCSEGWYYQESEINGECPECGTPTVGGIAYEGCCWSPVSCELCGYAPCDGSC